MDFIPIDPKLNKISGLIVEAAYQVHSTLGPDLLESVYQKCMFIELKEKGVSVVTEARIPLQYKHHDVDANLRIDVLVEDKIIVELKSVDHLLPVHEAQLLSYMKLSKNVWDY
ncbi:MAG: GxxExxY protein [Bacteroidota bacterium]